LGGGGILRGSMKYVVIFSEFSFSYLGNVFLS